MSVVTITGASGGLGHALCTAFSHQGHQIVVHYYTGKDRAETLSREMRNRGAKTLTIGADFRDRHQVREMAEAVMKEWGGTDLWINNAGITWDRLVQDLKEEEWQEVISINLRGAFLGIQEAARIMIPQHKGHIINISSLVGLKGNIGQSAYSASKAGIVALTKTAAKEFGPFNIQVNAVLPGYLPTQMTRNLHPRQVDKMIGENVLGRSSDVEEVAQFICQLLKMKHVSGQVFNLDSRII
jgi:3-oxoacyl-[acyl-carrier protein] reductase